MRKKYLLLVLLLFCVCTGLRAQTFSLITGREPVASLDGLWRFHTGDNPAWASPNLDDSQWPLVRSDEDWAKQGYPGYSGYAWYRFQVVVPPGEGAISLLLPSIMTSYQVFVDGKLAKTVGWMPPHGNGTPHPLPVIFPLPVAASKDPRPITIALRVWHWYVWSNYHGGGPQTGGGLVGQSSLLQRETKLSRDSALLATGGFYTIGLADCIAGLLALLLFLIRRTEREYLWFACLELIGAAHSIYFIYCQIVPVTIHMRDRVNGILECAISLFLIAFLFTLLRARRTLLLYLAIAAPLLVLAILLPVELHLLFVGWGNFADALLGTIIFIWAADLLIQKTRAGFSDARLLILPVLLTLMLGSVEAAVYATFQLGWQRVTQGDWFLFTRPFDFAVDDAVEILFLLAMLAILINRFARTRREEQRIAGELEAARSMQSLLVPATAPSTPGFAVESVYLPASEVGGDFFHVQPGDDGSLLIVVGDVSGKGLKAAMTVSTIVGALRAYPLRAPAEVLGNLNRVLHGQVKGFVTCAAALIAADGAMTLANAGHLSPYRNGEEMPVDSGLPLGIVAEGDYSERSYQLAPGDRLTFLSDGVVEATNEKKQLFGFERTQAISNQPAQAIAEAAKNFGQEDDITVLSVIRMVNMKAAIA